MASPTQAANLTGKKKDTGGEEGAPEVQKGAPVLFHGGLCDTFRLIPTLGMPWENLPRAIAMQSV